MVPSDLNDVLPRADIGWCKKPAHLVRFACSGQPEMSAAVGTCARWVYAPIRMTGDPRTALAEARGSDSLLG